MKIAVLTDSTAYLKPEYVEKYGIAVIPMPVIFGQEMFKEGIDFTTKSFYERMRIDPHSPTTAQVSMGEMQVLFDQLADEGYDTVICVHLSSGISGLVTNIANYANSVKNIKVVAFDSQIDCAGTGYMALRAAKMAQEGKELPEIIASLEELRDTTHVLFVVDDLTQLIRNGRLNNREGFVANILKIKPILDMETDGKIMAIEKTRAMKRAYRHVKKRFTEAISKVDYPIRGTVIDANNDELSAAWMADLQKSFPEIPFERGDIGPVVGSHTGEKAMGIIWGKDWMQD